MAKVSESHGGLTISEILWRAMECLGSRILAIHVDSIRAEKKHWHGRVPLEQCALKRIHDSEATGFRVECRLFQSSKCLPLRAPFCLF
jgi:hypothetical protein